MISDADRKAFELAIEMFRARGRSDREYIDAKIEREGFKSAGRFASYSAQMDLLHLPPWAFPPCSIDTGDIDKLIAGPDNTHGKRTAAVLLRRMLELGLSQFAPDPMRAIEAATKRDPAA